MPAVEWFLLIGTLKIPKDPLQRPSRRAPAIGAWTPEARGNGGLTSGVHGKPKQRRHRSPRPTANNGRSCAPALRKKLRLSGPQPHTPGGKPSRSGLLADPTHGIVDELRAVAQAELGLNIAPMSIHCLDAEVERLGDVVAVAALTDEHSYVAARETIDELMCRGRLSMESVTFLRGRTLQSSFIVVDEAQNLEPTTVKTILTRVGAGAKIVFCGDRDQIDAPYLSRHNNGLAVLLDAFRGQECFGGVRLMTCERSEVAALAARLL